VNDTTLLWILGAVVAGVVIAFVHPSSPSGAAPAAEPYVDAGPDLALSECCTTHLSAEGYDPEGGPVSVSWSAPRGCFDDASSLRPHYTTPAVSSTQEVVTLTLTVTNEAGASASDTVLVRVRNVVRPSTQPTCGMAAPLPRYAVLLETPVAPPEEHERAEPTPRTALSLCPNIPESAPPAGRMISRCAALAIDEGSSIRLDGRVWDPDCNLAGFSWSADKGSFDDPTSLHPVYRAPMTTDCLGEDVRITLTAVDRCCAATSTHLVLHVSNLNHPPTADAGADLIVDECSTVHLTCTGTDPDGDSLSFRWTAACGRGSFADPTVLHPLYTAPSVDRCDGEEIVLTLTVTDPCGLSASDSIRVHVRDTAEAAVPPRSP